MSTHNMFIWRNKLSLNYHQNALIICLFYLQIETSRPKSKTRRFRFQSPEQEARKVG